MDIILWQQKLCTSDFQATTGRYRLGTKRNFETGCLKAWEPLNSLVIYFCQSNQLCVLPLQPSKRRVVHLSQNLSPTYLNSTIVHYAPWKLYFTTITCILGALGQSGLCLLFGCLLIIRHFCWHLQMAPVGKLIVYTNVYFSILRKNLPITDLTPLTWPNQSDNPSPA